MKKAILAGIVSVALTFGTVGGVFADGLFDLKSGPTEQKNTVFVDVGTFFTYLIAGGFGGGVGFERSFGDSFSGLIHAAAGGYTYTAYLGNTPSAFAFQIDVHGRWYFFKTALDKLFLDVGLGYDFYSYTNKYTDIDYWTGERETVDAGYNTSALTISPMLGWKFILGKGFVIEPAFGYTIGIGLDSPTIYGGATTYSASRFNIGLGLGWAF
ncbi:hypothetical protein FACS1894130_08440 [Spirochaetia bacterium]|nr:hypothetical protein FACS1894130_08440 [Spirochaetia bacterium]